jgi:MFS family permease
MRSERSLLRHRDFVRLWTGETISQLGSQVTLIALPLMAIRVLDATTLQVGMLEAAQFLPFLVIGLPAGAIVDRMRRRPVLITGDLGRALLLLSIPVAHWLGWLSLGQLMVVVFLAGILTVFFDVAYQSYLPALIERDQLPDGNAKLEISRSGAQIAGPGLAGVLIQWLAAPVAVLIDALSFVASAVAVLAIRAREPAPEPHEGAAAGAARPRLRHEIREGLRYVLGHPHLRNIAGCTATSNLFSALLQAVFLVYAVRSLGFGAGTIGLIFMIGNVGFLLGAAMARRVTDWLGLGHTICWSILVGGLGGVVIAIAPRTGALAWFIVGQALFSLGSPIYNISQVSYRQAITPFRMQGRMNATMRFMVWGTLPLGSLLGGLLGTTLGLRPALLIGGFGGLLAVPWVALSSVRSITEIPPPADDETSGTSAAVALSADPV